MKMSILNLYRFLFLAILAMGFTMSVCGQKDKADSLEKLLQIKSDTARVGVYIALAKEYSRTDAAAAEKYLQQSLSLSDSMEYSFGLAETNKALGELKIIRGEYAMAFTYLERALTLYRKLGNLEGVSDCYMNLSSVSNRLAEYPKALEQASNALVYARQANYLEGMAMAYNLMGIIYDNMGNFSSSLNNYQKSLEIFSSSGDKRGMAKVYLNIAIVYNKTNRRDEAENLLHKCVAIGKEYNDHRLLSIAYGNIGLMANEAGDFQKALEYYHLSLDMKVKIGDKHSILITRINIGAVYQQMGQPDRALAELGEALKLAGELGARKEMIDAYKLVADIHASRGNFKGAYEARSMQMALNDSVFGHDQLKYMADVEKKSAITQLESENKILRQQSLIDQLKIENSRFIRYYLLIGLAFAVVLIGLLIYQSSERRKNSRRLDEVNRQLLVINEQLKLSESNLAESNRSKDQFFSIISHDLRNPLASMVSFVRILRRDFDSLDAEERMTLIDEFEKIVNRTGTLLENLLLWSRSQTGKIKVSATHIQASSVPDDNIDLHEVAMKAKNISLHRDYHGQDIQVYADANMLNTVMRNLLSNAVKFTPQGGSITVGYHVHRKECIFSVKDSGIGIDEDKMATLFDLGHTYIRTGTASEKGSGLGLVLCKDFVERNNGRIWVESVAGEGTTFYFSVPVASAN